MRKIVWILEDRAAAYSMTHLRIKKKMKSYKKFMSLKKKSQVIFKNWK